VSSDRPVRVVVQHDTTDRDAVRAVTNLLRALPGARVRLVLHGPAVLTSRADVTELDDLPPEAEVVACRTALRDRGIDPADLRPDVGTVPSGVAEVVQLQHDGWSYLRV
jgi:intracellular sulfur oxidation DsrE/DsrF family protein